MMVRVGSPAVSVGGNFGREGRSPSSIVLIDHMIPEDTRLGSSCTSSIEHVYGVPAWRCHSSDHLQYAVPLIDQIALVGHPEAKT